jgi:hypothetical protein
MKYLLSLVTGLRTRGFVIEPENGEVMVQNIHKPSWDDKRNLFIICMFKTEVYAMLFAEQQIQKSLESEE